MEARNSLDIAQYGPVATGKEEMETLQTGFGCSRPLFTVVEHLGNKPDHLACRNQVQIAPMCLILKIHLTF